MLKLIHKNFITRMVTFVILGIITVGLVVTFLNPPISYIASLFLGMFTGAFCMYDYNPGKTV